MIEAIFVAVAMLITPAGPEFAANPNLFTSLEACEEHRAYADARIPEGVRLIESKCIVFGANA